jgi:hypothetical protein
VDARRFKSEGNYFTYEDEFGYLFGSGWSEGSKRGRIEDARLVFWFDN